MFIHLPATRSSCTRGAVSFSLQPFPSAAVDPAAASLLGGLNSPDLFLQGCFSLPQSVPQQEKQGKGQEGGGGGQQRGSQDEGAQPQPEPQEQEEQERRQERQERFQVQVSLWVQVSLQIRDQRSLQEVWLQGPRAAQERRRGRRAREGLALSLPLPR